MTNEHDDEAAKRYPHLYLPVKGYVFVVAYGRSGSTLTQNLLNALPGYCIRGENANLVSLLCRTIHILKTHPMHTTRRHEITLPSEQRSGYLKNIIGQKFDPWYGAELVDPMSYARGVFDSFVAEILRIEPGTSVAGFKEIRFHEDKQFFPHMLDIMQEVFPKTKFIFQMRDYEEVKDSSWWKNTPPEKVRNIITTADAMFLEYAKDRDNCHVIRYENYKSKPTEEIGNLLRFLDEDVDMKVMMDVMEKKLRH